MKSNEVFFYSGYGYDGSYFYHNSETNELSLVITHKVNFDNDSEGLHLKKLDTFEIYKTIENVETSEIEQNCLVLLDRMDRDFENVLNFN